MQRKKKIGLAVLGLLIAAYLALCFLVPRWWSGKCGPGCDRHLSYAVVLPWAIHLHNFSLRFGDPEQERWELAFQKARLKPYWSELFRGRPVFREASVAGLTVKFGEGDRPKPAGSEPLPIFGVDKLEVAGGRFAYERKWRGRVGTLRFADIDLTASALGTTDSLRRGSTPIHLAAKMEGGGKIGIEMAARFFEHNPELLLRLSLEGQDLAATNSYFRPVEDLELKGLLEEARCEVRGSHQEMRASVALRFRGLDVDLHPGKERSGLAAFIGDLLAGTAFREKTKGRSFAPGYATIQRTKADSHVGFVLRALKEAAAQAAMH